MNIQNLLINDNTSEKRNLNKISPEKWHRVLVIKLEVFLAFKYPSANCETQPN